MNHRERIERAVATFYHGQGIDPPASRGRKAKAPRKHPTERQEQMVLVDWLKAHGILYCHVPNEGRRGPIGGAMQKRIGVKAGVPDILIFSWPVHWRGVVWATDGGVPPRGVAIELKAIDGGKPSENQVAWLDDLRTYGWVAKCCWGADEAIRWLVSLGFGHG